MGEQEQIEQQIEEVARSLHATIDAVGRFSTDVTVNAEATWAKMIELLGVMDSLVTLVDRALDRVLQLEERVAGLELRGRLAATTYTTTYPRGSDDA